MAIKNKKPRRTTTPHPAKKKKQPPQTSVGGGKRKRQRDKPERKDPLKRSVLRNSQQYIQVKKGIRRLYDLGGGGVGGGVNVGGGWEGVLGGTLGGNLGGVGWSIKNGGRGPILLFNFMEGTKYVSVIFQKHP